MGLPRKPPSAWRRLMDPSSAPHPDVGQFVLRPLRGDKVVYREVPFDSPADALAALEAKGLDPRFYEVARHEARVPASEWEVVTPVDPGDVSDPKADVVVDLLAGEPIRNALGQPLRFATNAEAVSWAREHLVDTPWMIESCDEYIPETPVEDQWYVRSAYGLLYRHPTTEAPVRFPTYARALSAASYLTTRLTAAGWQPIRVREVARDIGAEATLAITVLRGFAVYSPTDGYVVAAHHTGVVAVRYDDESTAWGIAATGVGWRPVPFPDRWGIVTLNRSAVETGDDQEGFRTYAEAREHALAWSDGPFEIVGSPFTGVVVLEARERLARQGRSEMIVGWAIVTPDEFILDDGRRPFTHADATTAIVTVRERVGAALIIPYAPNDDALTSAHVARAREQLRQAPAIDTYLPPFAPLARVYHLRRRMPEWATPSDFEVFSSRQRVMAHVALLLSQGDPGPWDLREEQGGETTDWEQLALPEPEETRP